MATAWAWILDVLCEAWRRLTASPHSRRRQLEALRALDDRLLADIGVSRAEARAGRPLAPRGRPGEGPAAVATRRGRGRRALSALTHS